MAKSEKRYKQLAQKRAQKESRYNAARARGDEGGKSPYQQKIQRKLGNGRIDPRWMWWIDSAERPKGITHNELTAARAEMEENARQIERQREVFSS